LEKTALHPKIIKVQINDKGIQRNRSNSRPHNLHSETSLIEQNSQPIVTGPTELRSVNLKVVDIGTFKN
jgi:hypothetical protein